MKKLKLFLIKANVDIDVYDVVCGDVVCAEDEQEAIQLSDVNKEDIQSITEIGQANENIRKGQILYDYKAG